MSRTTFVTDSDPIADALSRWLSSKLQNTAIVTTSNPRDVDVVVPKRMDAGIAEHLIVVADPVDRTQPTVVGDALTVVRGWLAGLSPMQVRTGGMRLIAEHMHAREEGFEVVARLAHQLTPVSASLRGPKTKRGRPKGSDPFRGAGFDVCVTLLLHPTRSWTERAIAEQSQRPPAVAHRVLTELAQRGYVRRGRGATALRDPRLLRDDLLASWRARVGVPRQHVIRMLAPPKAPLDKTLQRAARQSGTHPLLAGWSAIEGPNALVDQPLTLYAPPAFGAALREHGFEEYSGARASVILWEPPERAVYAEPRALQSGAATNAVVAWLDIALEGGVRNEGALASLWTSVMTAEAA